MHKTKPMWITMLLVALFVCGWTAEILAQSGSGGSITMAPAPPLAADDGIAITEGSVGLSTPVVLSIDFPRLIPGNGSQIFGDVTWLDLGGDIVTIDMVDLLCPPNFTCNFGEIPIVSTQRLGNASFFIFCNNTTTRTVIFVVNFIPFDADGKGIARPLLYRCSPA